jgi:hypothetical protein
VVPAVFALVALAAGCSSDDSTDQVGVGPTGGQDVTSPLTAPPLPSACDDLVELVGVVDPGVAADLLRGMNAEGDAELAFARDRMIVLADWLDGGEQGPVPVDSVQYDEVFGIIDVWAITECGEDNLFTGGLFLGYTPAADDLTG